MRSSIFLVFMLLIGCAAPNISPKPNANGEWFDRATSKCVESFIFHPTGILDGYFKRIVTCSKIDVPPAVTASDLMR